MEGKGRLSRGACVGLGSGWEVQLRGGVCRGVGDVDGGLEGKI